MSGLNSESFTTIRVRLTAALAAALMPIFVLGIVQSALSFHREGVAIRENLGAAAQRSAAAARTRLEGAEILLETLAPGAVGFQCAQRLAQVSKRLPGYANLIRFDRQGRVACAAEGVQADPGRIDRAWFRRLADGEGLTITRETGEVYAGAPAVLAAARATRTDGSFDGAFAAIIPLEALRPSLSDPVLPRHAEVALIDRAGEYINATRAEAFPDLPAAWRDRTREEGELVWYGDDQEGRRRIYSATPVVGEEIYVVLSAPSPGLWSWAWLNPLTSLLLPLLTFALALAAVSIAADRVVVRWIAYLQRIAALYARGRLSVRPIQAGAMPPEIRELAETMEQMADAIVGRDASLRDSLAQKDALMREIHHRVKNNLQIISSLLNMQQRALSDPAARAAMSDTRQRITALALIYRALYQGPDLKRVDLRPFLEELTAQLVAGEMLHGPPVRTELHVDALVIDPDRLAPLALFAVEAITNAQKHAFAGRGGTLTVNFRVRDMVGELEIADTGHAKVETLSATGVGRTLMTAFARQLRGTTELALNEGGGVTAKLTFPIPPPEMVIPDSPEGNHGPA
ncbi:sensor histidine kinase [Phenylobacterium immobile]|uniref:sensor histidine kinase PhyK n=1 Tax=Phenylobacterium immobile TaxID=21 RepID=UPI000A6B67C4|nr:sensor histidine kinase [Phenylobacterium immobile]